MEHIMVHGGSYYLLTGTRHDCCSQHIVSDTVCYLADNVGSGWSNDRYIRFLGYGYVLDAVLEIAVEGIYETLVLCQCLECERMSWQHGRLLPAL